ncbi:9931_t:CDS:2 [Gigaspora margarita]|uniref:9931_t:CDS:1 n=1 Tax=Gigaspora margarita TaxID=4874 RepID=A0ABM8W4N0_GIGMA|nr:9931_t:CDS:2 [Gigaspora margarita]
MKIPKAGKQKAFNYYKNSVNMTKNVWHKVDDNPHLNVGYLSCGKLILHDFNLKTFVSNTSIIFAQGLMLFWCILLGIGIGDDSLFPQSIVTGNGTISAFIAIYYRFTIPESQCYTMDIERSINKSATNKSTTDIKDPYETLFKASVGNISITMLGTVPVIGLLYSSLIFGSTSNSTYGYTLSQLFSNFGPNITTFVVPGEVFPTRYRSTSHGINAVIGKLGVIISQDIGGALGSNSFMNWLFVIFAIFMFSGLIVTYFCVPKTKTLSLEDLSNEDKPKLEVDNNNQVNNSNQVYNNNQVNNNYQVNNNDQVYNMDHVNNNN